MEETAAEKAARELAQLKEEAAQGLHAAPLPVLPPPMKRARIGKDDRFDSKPERVPGRYEESRAKSRRQALAHDAIYYRKGRR